MYVLSEVHDPVKEEVIGGYLINHTLCAIVLVCIVIVIKIVYVCFQEFVLHKEKGYLLPTWVRKIICWRFDSSCHHTGQKWKKCERYYLYYSHALLRIHVIGSQKSVRIEPPSLPSDHSSPATSPLSQLKHSSAVIIWMCRASFTSSSCPLPWSSTVVAEHVW